MGTAEIDGGGVSAIDRTGTDLSERALTPPNLVSPGSAAWKEIVVAIGVPFSGKSTLAEQYRQAGWAVIERDPLLAEISESESFRAQVLAALRETQPSSVEELYCVRSSIATAMLGEAVRRLVRESAQRNIFYDGTNLEPATRAEIVALSAEGARVHALFLSPPLEQIVARAAVASVRGERAGRLNQEAMQAFRWMAPRLVPPTIEEGFATVTEINSSGGLSLSYP